MNILGLIQSQLSPETVGQVSKAIGESPDTTKSALGATFPALLGALVGKATSSTNGASEIFDMLTQGAGKWPESIAGAAGSPAPTTPAASQSLLSSLLGSKLGAVVEFIANRCGIRTGSATSLLGMAAPLLMGTVGKQVASQGLGVAGLSKLLASQTQYLKDALPSGLANTLGIGNLLSGAPEKVTASLEDKTNRPMQVPGAGRELVRARGGNIFKWAWVPIVIILGAWFLASRSRQTTTGMGGATDTTRAETATTSGVRAPDLSSLKLSPGGIADRAAQAISAGDWNKAIDLSGLEVDSSGTLSGPAKSQIQELGQVLSAVPSVKVRIAGYGDTQEAGLSRANAIKSALAATGITADRILVSGKTGTGTATLSLER